jgi:predicted membrane protein
MDIKLLLKAVLTVLALFLGFYLFGQSLDYAVRTFSKQAVSNAMFIAMAVGLTFVYYQLYKANSK